MQTGATMDHSTTRRAARMRRNATGWSMAARTCGASTASTLVAGTSEYIQLDRTKAKARLPWSSKSWLTRSGGRKNQAELIMAALSATVRSVSNGRRKTRRYSWTMAWARLSGGRVPVRTAGGGAGSDAAGTIRPYTLPTERHGNRVPGRWRPGKADAMMR